MSASNIQQFHVLLAPDEMGDTKYTNIKILSSPSPKSSPLRPKPKPKAVQNPNPSPIGTGGDTIITWATTPPPPITFNLEGVL